MPPASRDKQRIAETNLTLHTHLQPRHLVVVATSTPHRPLERAPLLPLHHLSPPHRGARAAPNTTLHVVENGIAELGREQAHVFAAGELHEEIGVRVAVQGRVGGGLAQPDAGGVDVAFACRED